MTPTSLYRSNTHIKVSKPSALSFSYHVPTTQLGKTIRERRVAPPMQRIDLKRCLGKLAPSWKPQGLRVFATGATLQESLGLPSKHVPIATAHARSVSLQGTPRLNVRPCLRGYPLGQAWFQNSPCCAVQWTVQQQGARKCRGVSRI